jgi:DNA-binding transcriptional MocR family regulator
MSSDRDDGGTFTQDYIDERLERVLRAAGSSLRHYTPQGKEELRKTMRKLLEDVRALAAHKREDGERLVGRFSHE